MNVGNKYPSFKKNAIIHKPIFNKNGATSPYKTNDHEIFDVSMLNKNTNLRNEIKNRTKKKQKIKFLIQNNE